MHTPGPWAVTRGGQREPFSIEASTRTVALVKTCRNETLANARLIAAAPELLAALERVLDSSWDGPIDADHPARSMGAAAIAKAKGETT